MLLNKRLECPLSVIHRVINNICFYWLDAAPPRKATQYSEKKQKKGRKKFPSQNTFDVALRMSRAKPFYFFERTP